MEPRLDRRKSKSLSAATGGRGFGAFRAAILAGCLVLSHLVVSPPAWAGGNFNLQQAPGGITLSQVANNYQSSFGTVDALGINTGAAGMTRITTTTGTLYYTPYQLIVVGGLPSGHSATVTAYLSSNFTNNSAVVMYSCPSSSACTSFGSYAPMSVNAGAQTTVVGLPGIVKNQVATAGIAIWVPNNNGATAYTGNDNAVVTFTATDITAGTTIETLTWGFNLAPAGVTIQSAVRLTLSTGTAATPHCIITATGGTPDYTVSFGNVDGMGINAGSCGSKFAPAVVGTDNAIYWSDYNLTPAFSDQNPIASSKITAQVTTNFATTNVFVVRDAANSATVPTSASQMTAMGVATADTIATGVTSGTALTRFIGIAVTPANGVGLAGAKSATVTFTLTVM